jgi:hypothetical protein
MENEKQSFTPEESLELISRTIASYKSSYKRKNYYFLLWGWAFCYTQDTAYE